MIDEYNTDGTGWARFSDDRVMRYRLARSLTTTRLEIVNGRVLGLLRVVWLLLNPSTADAFKPDPTVRECRKRAVPLGADVTEVVNLWALRSPYPADLRKRAVGSRGDDAINNAEILAACTGAHLVIAAWGNHGVLDHRATIVRRLLAEAGIALHHLGTTQHGHPKHPLGRGHHRIPADQRPIAWSTT
jgi:hypothetical protein